MNEILPQAAPAGSPIDLDEIRNLFAAFLHSNPYSSIDISEGIAEIANPWGDDSLRIRLPDPHRMADVLNHLILSPRFSGIYHADTKQLEIIWTAFEISTPSQEVIGRSFSFNANNVVHQCDYKRSSDRLLAIAKNFYPIKLSVTNFRNLQSFHLLQRNPPEEWNSFSSNGPISFWISNIDWDEAGVVDLTAHLSFYMNYFDTRSPVILTHEPSEHKKTERNRYIRGQFPKQITARSLDENLLSFWNYIGKDPSQNTMIAFILYYRIIEYAAFHYIDSTMRYELRRALMAPDFTPDSVAIIERIVGAVSIKKTDEVPRFKSLIQHCVKPELLWPDVSKNLEYFSQQTTFEGGFAVSPLLTKKETADTFDASRVAVFSDTIRKIRNTLSHGKDQETSGVILPTLQNFNLLRPWLHLIATAAGEVILHKDVT